MPDFGPPPQILAVTEIDPTTGNATVICRGRLVADYRDDFHDEVRRLIPASKRIVLDFSEVTHMDSSGLGTVVRLLCRGQVRRLRPAAGQPQHRHPQNPQRHEPAVLLHRRLNFGDRLLNPHLHSPGAAQRYAVIPLTGSPPAALAGCQATPPQFRA